MKLFIISREIGIEYDVYKSAVVAAESEEHARTIHPSDGLDIDKFNYSHEEWVTDLSLITVKYIGEAAPGTKAGSIHAYYIQS